MSFKLGKVISYLVQFLFKNYGKYDPADDVSDLNSSIE